MKEKSEKLLWKIQPAADALDCSPTTIYRGIKAKKIKSVPFGNDTRIPDSEMRRLAKEGL